MAAARNGVAVAAAWLVFALVPFAFGSARSSPPSRQPQAPPSVQQQAGSPASVAPDDEKAIREVVRGFYAARVAKDLPAYASLWFSKAPRRVTTFFPLDIAFPYDSLEVGSFTLSRLAADSGLTMSARVTVPVKVRVKPNEPLRSETWIRRMQFIRDGDSWKVYGETAAVDDLAIDISRATDEETRQRLLAADPELVNEELAFAIETQGDRHAVSGNMAGAPRFYELEIRIGERVGSRLAVARGHLKIGQLLVVQPGPHREAIEHFRKALETFEALGDRARIAAAERGLGTAYYMNDDQASREHYKRAIDLLETFSDRLDLAGALHAYGNACFMTGDYGAALGAYERSMAVQETAGAKAGVPSLWQAIGRVQKEQRDYDAAVESYKKSVPDPRLADAALRVAALTGVADVYRLQGRFELALEEYGKALAEVKAANDRQTAMTIEADIGNVYMSEQQPGAALVHYQQSLELAQQLQNQAGIARALAGSGTAHFADMRYEAALDAYVRSLPLRQQMNDKPAIAWTYAHIGLVHSALEKHDEALAAYQQAHDLSNSLSDAAAVAVTQTLMAREHAELGHPDVALDLAEKAAGIARAIESDDTLAQARTVAGRVLEAKGDRAGAERLLLEAVAAIESKRARNGDEPSDDFFGDVLGAYRAMALLKADNGQAADALWFAERAQLSLLSEVLAGNRSLIVRGVSSELQEQERRLARDARSLRIQADKERKRATPDASRLQTLNTRLAEADQRRAAFADTLYAQYPALKLQRGLFPAAVFDALQSLLPDGKTALVEFVTSEKRAMAIVLAKDATGHARILARPIDIKLLDLAKRVREFRARVRERDKAVTTAARELYDLLLAPVADQLAGTTRLVIVPDGPLWSIPFQALQGPDGRFLIERVSVSYAPSLTVAALLANGQLAPAPTPATRRVVAIGNQRPADMERLTLLNPGLDLKPLPNVEQEVRNVRLAYGPSRAKAYVGSAAKTEPAVAEARDAATLHLATFFVPSPASPLRSLFVLGATADATPHVVETRDWMDGAMPPLTIVSRVQTERVSGEGQVPIGLTWGFFVSGTRAAVLPAWPDDSQGALAVMTGLHRALARRTVTPTPVSKALRQAILPLLAGPHRHPFYWANFSVIGVDWEGRTGS